MAVRLVVGLGNPGRRYRHTRHNVGFMVVDRLFELHRSDGWELLGDNLVAQIEELGVSVAKPLSFMNRSGHAVRQLLRIMDVRVRQMLVVVDDVDLPLGTLRIRPSGGPGTHNGMRSLVAEVGDAFPRLRVGIAGSGEPEDLAEYVLSPFEPHELPTVDKVLSKAVEAVETVIVEGLETAMNRFNRKVA